MVASLNGVNSLNALEISNSLQQSNNARLQLLTDPNISGVSGSQLTDALNQANGIFNSLQGGGLGGGSDFLSTLGGVGLQNMDLYGLSNIGLGSFDSSGNDQYLAGALSPTSSIGAGIASFMTPGTMGGTLMQEAYAAQFKQDQQQAQQLQSLYLQDYQALSLKKQMGGGLTISDYVQAQQITAALQQATAKVQQDYMTLATQSGGLSNSVGSQGANPLMSGLG